MRHFLLCVIILLAAPVAFGQYASDIIVQLTGEEVENPPLVVINGEVVEHAVLRTLTDDDILSFRFIQADVASEIYGEEGQHGAIEITTEIEAIQDRYAILNQHPEPLNGWGEVQNRARLTDEARAAGISGYVMLSFVVDSEGNTSSVTVTQGRGYGLDEKAIQIIEETPFLPGRVDGEAVTVRVEAQLLFSP